MTKDRRSHPLMVPFLFPPAELTLNCSQSALGLLDQGADLQEQELSVLREASFKKLDISPKTVRFKCRLLRTAGGRNTSMHR